MKSVQTVVTVIEVYKTNLMVKPWYGSILRLSLTCQAVSNTSSDGPVMRTRSDFEDHSITKSPSGRYTGKGMSFFAFPMRTAATTTAQSPAPRAQVQYAQVQSALRSQLCPTLCRRWYTRTQCLFATGKRYGVQKMSEFALIRGRFVRILCFQQIYCVWVIRRNACDTPITSNNIKKHIRIFIFRNCVQSSWDICRIEDRCPHIDTNCVRRWNQFGN